MRRYVFYHNGVMSLTPHISVAWVFCSTSGELLNCERRKEGLKKIMKFKGVPKNIFLRGILEFKGELGCLKTLCNLFGNIG